MTEDEKAAAIVADMKNCLTHICANSVEIKSAKWHAASTLARCAMLVLAGREPTTQESLDWIGKQGWSFVDKWKDSLHDMKASPGGLRELPKCHCGKDAEFIIDREPRCFEHRTTHREGR